MHCGCGHIRLAAVSGTGITMGATTYSNVVFGAATGQPSTGARATDMPAKVGHAASRFFRPGPEVVSEAIPVFFIGRNRDGLWVAREAEGRRGGLFWFRQSALRFAKTSARPAACATLFPQARFELDIENSGNPVVTHLGFAKRFLTHPLHVFVLIIRKTMRF
jgi:hypothetical protein